MKSTKKLTLGAASVALGVVFSLLGYYIPVLDLSASAMASLIMVFVYSELGSPYTWMVWIATSVLSCVFCFGSLVWLVYFLVFGIYPILKGYIERLPRFLWILLKLLFVNAAMLLCLLGCQFILSIPFFGEVPEFITFPVEIVYASLWVLLNLAFLLYDLFLRVMSRFYFGVIRPKIKQILK